MKKIAIAVSFAAFLAGNAVALEAHLETFESGTAGEAMSGWTGDGIVKAYDPSAPSAPSCGLPATNTTDTMSFGSKYLEVGGAVVNSSFFSSDISVVDLMVMATRAPDDVALALPDGATGVKFAVAVDSNGCLNVYCRPKTNDLAAAEFIPVSTRLTSDQWVRVSLQFDYTGNFCKVLLDGIPCVTSNGALTPSDATKDGSWYKLAADASRVVSLEVMGTKGLDLVCTRQLETSPSGAPVSPVVIPEGAVATTDSGVVVKRSWLAAQGLDTVADNTPAPDGSGMTVLEKYAAGLDVDDGETLTLAAVPQNDDTSGLVKFDFPGSDTGYNEFVIEHLRNGEFVALTGENVNIDAKAGATKTMTASFPLSLVDSLGVVYFRIKARTKAE